MVKSCTNLANIQMSISVSKVNQKFCSIASLQNNFS